MSWGVRPGWMVLRINGIPVPQDATKSDQIIVSEITKSIDGGGRIKIHFRVTSSQIDENKDDHKERNSKEKTMLGCEWPTTKHWPTIDLKPGVSIVIARDIPAERQGTNNGGAATWHKVVIPAGTVADVYAKDQKSVKIRRGKKTVNSILIKQTVSGNTLYVKTYNVLGQCNARPVKPDSNTLYRVSPEWFSHLRIKRAVRPHTIQTIKNEPPDYKFNVIVIGDGDVGKSSLIRRFRERVILVRRGAPK